jgi:hypothetical protein
LKKRSPSIVDQRQSEGRTATHWHRSVATDDSDKPFSGTSRSRAGQLVDGILGSEIRRLPLKGAL